MKILVAFDGSDNAISALDYGMDMKKKNPGSTLTIIHVAINNMYYASFGNTDMDAVERDLAENAMKKAMEHLGTEDKDVKTTIQKGISAADVIVSYAEEHKFDAIVIGSRGLSNVKRFLLGSVSQKVAQHAHCNVTLVK